METKQIGIWHCELEQVPAGKHLSCGARYFDENHKEEVVALVGPYTESAPDDLIWQEARWMIDRFEQHAKKEGIALQPLDLGG